MNKKSKIPKYVLMICPIFFHIAQSLFPGHLKVLFFRFAQWGTPLCEDVKRDLEECTFFTNPPYPRKMKNDKEANYTKEVNLLLSFTLA
jgi:hypothetical protein